MKIEEVIKKLNNSLGEEELKRLEVQTKEITNEISHQIKRKKIKAEVFVGGSFAKGTIIRRDKYDIDIFVRFDEKYQNPDEMLQVILKNASKSLKLKLKTIHGSRDYFAFQMKNVVFEIVPVRKIIRPSLAVNSTDLSYFHVKYVKDCIKKKKNLAKEILTAKSFCRAQRVYGAESWIRGFSGYALECLVINYGSFEKMLKMLASTKEQVILDPSKHYKNKNDIVIELNESKRKGPIILVDPTYKHRNVCSALSKQTFGKFQQSALAFLKKPSLDFFEFKNIDENELIEISKKMNGEYCRIKIKTNKQEGDIAGAKLEKFHRFIVQEVSKFYEVKKSIFDFDEKQSAEIYLIVKPNKNMQQVGPFVKDVHNSAIFKQKHRDSFVKSGRLYAPISVLKVKDFLEKWKTERQGQIKGMDVDYMDINP